MIQPIEHIEDPQELWETAQRKLGNVDKELTAYDGLVRIEQARRRPVLKPSVEVETIAVQGELF